MNDRVLIILPNQLYEDIPMEKYSDVYIVEESCFFYDADYKPFRIHKIKIAFLKAAMSHFYDTVKSKHKTKTRVSYVEYQEADAFYKTLADKEIDCYDPTDFDIERKFAKLFGTRVNFLDSPNFLLSKEQLQEYDKKTGRRAVRHSSFYEFAKTKLGVLENVANMDKYNRSSPDAFLSKVEWQPYRYPRRLSKYYRQGKAYAQSPVFDKHIGTPDKVELYPITYREAYKHLDAFLEDKFRHFGKYQDAMIEKNPVLFHSFISALLNCGLLCPHRILQRVMAKQGKVPIEALEGFVRQLIGWREFERFLYVFRYEDIVASNLPENKKRIKKWTDWIDGTTGILPLDKEIKKAMTYGYAHHIVRLMIFMNFMILCELKPSEIYRWFMEVVCMDAYSWVMISNIYTMGYFWNGAMTKPYLSSSRYVLNMSDYKKDGHWEEIWTGLYKRFVLTKPSKYVFFYKRTVKAGEKVDESVDAFLKQTVK